MDLDVRLPAKKLDPKKEPDATVEFVVDCVLAAERSIHGIENGQARFDLVLRYVKCHVKLPLCHRDYSAKLMVRMVYGTIARGVPPHLRATQPPASRRA